jgi:SRSO17 transposase
MEGLNMVETLQQWTDELEQLHSRIAPRFRRAEPRRRALGYLKGLLATVERKNGWHLAELIGEATPDGVQRLLNAADWDGDAVRDDLRQYVVEHLGADDGILLMDETGFLKKGTHSAGVKRQYSGTAGRIENCQIGVFLCYASERGSAFIDRELYLPKEWVDDEARRSEVALPEEIGFATKPQLARAMLERAFEAEVPCAWGVGDAIYGGDRRLRRFLEEAEQPFVLAVPSNEPLWSGGPTYMAAEEIAAGVEPGAWQRLSAGDGAKGPRLYDWALADLWRLQMSPEERSWGHYLLVRRSIEDPQEVAYSVVFARRAEASLERLARVAGMRWHIESCFESAKGECGLDEYEVRRWDAWHRHITLALLAHAFLSVVRSRERKRGILAT